MSRRDTCASCGGQPAYLVSAGEPGSAESYACAGHAGEVLMQVMRKGSMPHARVAYLGNFTWKPGITPADVYEKARQAGAHSRDGQEGHVMEDYLHLAVLAAVAAGSEPAQGLALAALATRNYAIERYT